jgi:hypothetical protein
MTDFRAFLQESTAPRNVTFVLHEKGNSFHVAFCTGIFGLLLAFHRQALYPIPGQGR